MEKQVLRIGKDEGEKGYSFDLRRVRVDLFHLLSIFLADEKYSKILKGPEDPLWKLASLGEPEVTRILINSAVVGRVIDDRDNHFLPKQDEFCGTLLKDYNNGSSAVGLSLREAFNKIIHDSEFHLSIVEPEQEQDFGFLEPTMYFMGELGGKRWEAQLDVVEYVRKFSQHIDELPKDQTFK